MTCFVFRDRPSEEKALLYFDGDQVLHLRLPPGVDPQCGPLGWGPRSGEGAYLTAFLLCQQCGVPDELLSEVPALLAREWVRHLPAGQNLVPEWVVQQEVVRLCVRVMADLNGN